QCKDAAQGKGVTFRQRTEAVMLKFISAVIAAAAFAGVLTLLSAPSTRLDAGPARDAAPQSTPVIQTAPALAAAAISPELVRLGVARALAVNGTGENRPLPSKNKWPRTSQHGRRPSRTLFRKGHPRPRPRRAKKREGLSPGNSP